MNDKISNIPRLVENPKGVRIGLALLKIDQSDVHCLTDSTSPQCLASVNSGLETMEELPH